MTKQLKIRAFLRDDDDFKMYYNAFPQYEWVHAMQFTGLKDMNDNDIYEWDIVEMKPTVFAEPQLYMVFRHYGGEYRLETPAHGCPLWLRRNDVKVIGNVFENPDLMDKDFVERRMREVGRWHERQKNKRHNRNSGE